MNPAEFGAGHSEGVAGAKHDSGAPVVVFAVAAQWPVVHAPHTAVSEHVAQLLPGTGAVQSVVVPHRPVIFVAQWGAPPPLEARQNSDAHVVQTVPPEHCAQPEYATFAPAHVFVGFKHGVVDVASHCVQSSLASHGLPFTQPFVA